MAGYSFRQMHEEGCDPVLKRAEVDYINPLTLGDTMVSCLNISRRGPRYIFHQDIYKEDGTPVARGVLTLVVLKDGKVTRGDELQEAFGAYLTDDTKLKR